MHNSVTSFPYAEVERPKQPPWRFTCLPLIIFSPIVDQLLSLQQFLNMNISILSLLFAVLACISMVHATEDLLSNLLDGKRSFTIQGYLHRLTLTVRTFSFHSQLDRKSWSC